MTFCECRGYYKIETILMMYTYLSSPALEMKQTPQLNRPTMKHIALTYTLTLWYRDTPTPDRPIANQFDRPTKYSTLTGEKRKYYLHA